MVRLPNFFVNEIMGGYIFGLLERDNICVDKKSQERRCVLLFFNFFGTGLLYSFPKWFI